MRRTAHIVLAMLNHSTTTAYDIRRALRRRMDFIWSESSGQLYPAIKELLAAGMISEQREPGGRQRARLSITDDGRREVELWFTTRPAMDTPRDELVARVALLHGKPSPHLLQQLDDELYRAQHRADHERTLFPTPDRHLMNVGAIAGERLARRWVILLNEARAVWCREVLVHLRELAFPTHNPLASLPPQPPSSQLDFLQKENPND